MAETSGSPSRANAMSAVVEQRCNFWVTRPSLTFPLGKVTSFRNREHFSSGGFLWPIGQTVHDPNAQQGAHGSCLHFTASGASAFAPGFSSYGSHPMVVVPGPQLWDDPFGVAGLQNRCWHSSSGVVLFCAACLNLKPEDLKNPAFWREITQPKRYRQASSAHDDFMNQSQKSSNPKSLTGQS
jgi:hypothetical protein